MMIPAITLWEPYAHLLVWPGEKEFETRSWRPREIELPITVAIHAGKNTNVLDGIREYLAEMNAKGTPVTKYPSAFMRHFAYSARRHGALTPTGELRMEAFPLGCVIAVGTLAECAYMDTGLISRRTDKELAFGAWSVGRYAWRFENVRMLPEPVPVRGAQNLWMWDWDGRVA